MLTLGFTLGIKPISASTTILNLLYLIEESTHNNEETKVITVKELKFLDDCNSNFSSDNVFLVILKLWI